MRLPAVSTLNPNAGNRLFLQFNWLKSTDIFGFATLPAAGASPILPEHLIPTGSFSYVHLLSDSPERIPRGYTQTTWATTSAFPVSLRSRVVRLTMDHGFGSYAGYPQFFKEHIYTYSDMVSISHGNHNIKIGADFRRNIENSIFSVARPHEMFDPLFFGSGRRSAEEDAGVNPGICAPPCTTFNPAPQAQLQSNVRHLAGVSGVGAYVQDD